MKNLERFIISVQTVHEEQQMLVGSTEKGERKIIKGAFRDLFPTDTIVVYGTEEKNKKYGSHYRMNYYLEKKSENWLIKRLKFEYQLNDDDILERFLYPKDYADMKVYLSETKKIIQLLTLLKKKGIEHEEFYRIEQDFLWQYAELLTDIYQLLRYPRIQIAWLEEWIKQGLVRGKKETKTYYYAQQLLKEANQQGHFYLPIPLLEDSLSKYDLSVVDISNFDVFHREKGKLYLKEYHEIETQIAEHITKRVKGTQVASFDKKVVGEWEVDNAFSLAKNQKEAVWMALNQSFCVVTGGPGVGKTTVCKCITDILGNKYQIKMVAPTGRAAKRAQESTGLEASTIHSLLEYNGVRFQRDKECPIEADVLVIDESSMIDAPLLLALLEATPLETIIIFVGDVDQLPSVGSGQVLRDLIQSSVVPVTRLTEIFRQAADSPIIQCAYAVNGGELPAFTTHELLEYHDFEEEWMVLKKTLTVAKQLYQEHSLFDVQVLIPMYDGEVGINEVNKRIQAYLYPDAPTIKVGNYELRLGDKVIQTKNIKTKQIYNGDVGIITSVNAKQIKVKFQGHNHETVFERHEFSQLQLAYAVTVHRAQGSEYLYVVIPLVNSYHNMLQKNLFYTGITRAKKKLWLIYQLDAMEKAVNPESVPLRYTGLAEKLNERIS